MPTWTSRVCMCFTRLAPSSVTRAKRGVCFAAATPIRSTGGACGSITVVLASAASRKNY
ncbi:MAG: hypothetical protein HS123_23665 [Solibacteraceae bacterium]|nr:hypothetical protein [Solibacteraceae bacterium]